MPKMAEDRIAELDKEIDAHGREVKSRRDKIRKLNAQKEELLQQRESERFLEGMSDEQRASLAQVLKAEGVSSAEAHGRAG